MHLRNGAHGYGAVTKLLHWGTVAAIGAQFLVGYHMDVDEALDVEDDRLDAEAERREEEAESEAREDALDAR